MTCPKCGGATKVIDSRTNCESTVRRRVCRKCNYRYSTIELETDLAENLGMIPKGSASGNEFTDKTTNKENI